MKNLTRRSVSFLATLVLFLSSAGVYADDIWTVTTIDFRDQNVAIAVIDENAFHVAPSGGSQTTIAMDQFLSAERSTPTKAASKFVLDLFDGDRLCGDPVGVTGEQLTWKTPSLGQANVPLRKLLGMSRVGGGRKWDSISAATQDSVLLANGDLVTGIISDLSDAKVVVSGASGPVDVPIDSVAAIRFASAGEKIAAKKAMRIHLDDDSLVTVSNFKTAGDKFVMQTLDGQSREIARTHVVGIEQINGPLSWISSHQPGENVQTPFLETTWPARMNKSVGGQPIRFKDRTFAHGIGVHAYSKITFPLDGSYKTFRTQYAIDGDGQWADVTVRIKADDKILHEAQHVRAGVLSPVVQVDLGDAKSLTLEVDYGANNDVQDRFNWIEPALIRN